jgi:hypothetical protein
MGNLHGIASLGLFALALLAGMTGVALDSPTAAIGYAFLLSISFLAICGAYCTKCPCRTHSCGHFLPGLIVRYLPARRQTPYHGLDLTLTGQALAAMILYPQPWLWHRPLLLTLFWLCVGLSAIEIVLRVCRRCRNVHCPMQRMRSRNQVMDIR